MHGIGVLCCGVGRERICTWCVHRTHTRGRAGQEREREELGVWRIEWEEEMQSGAASSGR